ncbi:YaeQ family protein [Dasania marina]|uniref:YaeQ family protein n=1 Tax=Dasania marina TaxID=471499 RepID=UPI00035F9872|nr:YaeQ family protein [Dasania marina]
MAQKATIFKAQLNIADMDRHYYHEHNLTIARHPSETDERMMVRLAAFALNADEQLQLTKGLSNDDEPDLWQKSLSDEIVHWIDLGMPDEKRIRKACGRAQRVTIVCYGGNPAEHWYEKNANALQRCQNLTIINIASEESQALTELTQRTMHLQCNIQDEQLWCSSEQGSVTLTPQYWLRR